MENKESRGDSPLQFLWWIAKCTALGMTIMAGAILIGLLILLVAIKFVYIFSLVVGLIVCFGVGCMIMPENNKDQDDD